MGRFLGESGDETAERRPGGGKVPFRLLQRLWKRSRTPADRHRGGETRVANLAGAELDHPAQRDAGNSGRLGPRRGGHRRLAGETLLVESALAGDTQRRPVEQMVEVDGVEHE